MTAHVRGTVHVHDDVDRVSGDSHRRGRGRSSLPRRHTPRWHGHGRRRRSAAIPPVPCGRRP
nr:hypothetical protein [Pseudonocardia sp. HH130629-09]